MTIIIILINFKMISPNEIVDFSENDWGFYIDLENIRIYIFYLF